MSLINNKITLTSAHFPVMDLTGTRWIIFRDVPDLLEKYAKGSIALDYGCGGGTSTRFLKTNGFNAHGVDINELAIDIANKLDPTGIYALIESGKIPTNDCFYDVVFASWVLPHITSKPELEKVLLEISRCLKIGGVFIASVGNEYTYRYEWNSIDCRFKENAEQPYSGCILQARMKDNGCVFHNCFWSADDYEELFERAGLRILCVHRPLGKSSDGIRWINEDKAPFTDIYVVEKI